MQWSPILMTSCDIYLNLSLNDLQDWHLDGMQWTGVQRYTAQPADSQPQSTAPLMPRNTRTEHSIEMASDKFVSVIQISIYTTIIVSYKIVLRFWSLFLGTLKISRYLEERLYKTRFLCPKKENMARRLTTELRLFSISSCTLTGRHNACDTTTSISRFCDARDCPNNGAW